jgi:hypothetical protein
LIGGTKLFDQHAEIILQRDTQFRDERKKYYLTANTKKVIGTIEETMTTYKNLGNRLLKLFSLYTVASLELKVMDTHENVLGVIKKEKGSYNDFLLYAKNGDQLATISADVKVKSPSITVKDADGNEVLKVIGENQSTSFQVYDCITDKQISSLKRKSISKRSVKDNLLKDIDVWSIDHSNKEDIVTLSLLAIGIILEIYFFL